MKKEIFQSLVYNFLSILIGFIAVRVTLDYLGEDLYGRWGVALSLIYFLNLFEFGLGSSIRNYATEFLLNPKAKEKLVKHIKCIWDFQISLLYTISIITLIISILISPKNYNLFNILCAVFFPLVVCSNLASPLYNGLKKTRVVFKIKVLTALTSLIFLLILTKVFPVELFAIELVLIIKVLPIIGIKLFFLQRFFKHQIQAPFNHNFYIPKSENIPTLIGSEIFKTGVSYFSINIANLFMINSIPILLSSFIGEKEVTVFTINQKLYLVFLQFIYVILTPFWAHLNLQIRKRDILGLSKTINRLALICVLLFAGVFIIRFFEKPFHVAWLGETGYTNKGYTLLIAYYTLAMGIIAIIGHFLNALDELQLQRRLAIVNSIMILPTGLLFYYLTELQGASFLLSINIFLTFQMFLLFRQAIISYKYVRNSWVH